MRSLVDVMTLVDCYRFWLEEHGCCFNREGFPVFKQSWYLNEWPEQMVTYSERNSKLVKNKSKTVLCFFASDARIYPRFEKVLEEMDEYREYMGVVGGDVTVTWDMDREWQEETILLNQLFTAILAVNGVKIVQNMRIGQQETLRCFSSVPHGVMCASGTLGCEQIGNDSDLRYSEKLFFLMPSKVLVYGKRDPIMEEQLGNAGVPFRIFKDTHAQHKARKPR